MDFVDIIKKNTAIWFLVWSFAVGSTAFGIGRSMSKRDCENRLIYIQNTLENELKTRIAKISEVESMLEKERNDRLNIEKNMRNQLHSKNKEIAFHKLSISMLNGRVKSLQERLDPLKVLEPTWLKEDSAKYIFNGKVLLRVFHNSLGSQYSIRVAMIFPGNKELSFKLDPTERYPFGFNNNKYYFNYLEYKGFEHLGYFKISIAKQS